MVVVGGIVGALLALGIVVVPLEWISPDAFSESVEAILSVLIAAGGAFVGTWFVRRRQNA